MTRVANDLMGRINEIERDVYDGIDVKEGFADVYCMANDIGTYVERLDAENASLHIRLQSAYATIERQKLSILNQRRQLAATQKALEERNAGALKSRWRRSLAMWAERCAGLEKDLTACKAAIRTFVDEYESMAEVEGPRIDCWSCEACGYDGDCVVMDALDDLKRLGGGSDE